LIDTPSPFDDLANERIGIFSLLFKILSRTGHNVAGDAKIPQRRADEGMIGRAKRSIGFADHEQIEVAIGAGTPVGTAAEQPDLARVKVRSKAFDNPFKRRFQVAVDPDVC
jgi:hypothetical protein